MLETIDRTLVVVTHDLPFAAELCERAVILARGRLVADGECCDVLADDALLAAHDLELPRGFVLERVTLRGRPGDGSRRGRARPSRRPGTTRRSTCRVTRMGEPSFPLSQCWVANTRCLPRAKDGMRQRTAKRPRPSSTARPNTTSFTASTTRGLQNSICAQPVPRTTMRVPALPAAGVSVTFSVTAALAPVAPSRIAASARTAATGGRRGHRR